MATELYSVTTRLTVELATLVRAESAEAATDAVRNRRIESAWSETAPGEGALTHWILQSVPAYVPAEQRATLAARRV
jgi:hypothetical protein